MTASHWPLWPVCLRQNPIRIHHVPVSRDADIPVNRTIPVTCQIITDEIVPPRQCFGILAGRCPPGRFLCMERETGTIFRVADDT